MLKITWDDPRESQGTLYVFLLLSGYCQTGDPTQKASCMLSKHPTIEPKLQPHSEPLAGLIAPCWDLLSRGLLDVASHASDPGQAKCGGSRTLFITSAVSNLHRVWHRPLKLQCRASGVSSCLAAFNIQPPAFANVCYPSQA